MRGLSLLVIAALGLGCFIGDELDRGDELMQQLGPGKSAAKSPPAPQSASAGTSSGNEEPGFLERLSGWWDAATEPAPPPPDPSDAVVACTVGGSVTFMRARDCDVRGGTAKPH